MIFSPRELAERVCGELRFLWKIMSTALIGEYSAVLPCARGISAGVLQIEFVSKQQGSL